MIIYWFVTFTDNRESASFQYLLWLNTILSARSSSTPHQESSHSPSEDGVLNFASSTLFLGLLSNNLLMQYTREMLIIKKASKRLYFLSELKRARVAKQDLVLFYTSCIRSILTYASPVFFYALPEYLKNELERIQKRALRIICPGH